MLKFCIFLAFVANLNSVLTESSVQLVDEPTVGVIADEYIDDTEIRIKCGEKQILDLCPICPVRTCATKDKLIRCFVPVDLESKIPIKGTNCPRPRCRCADGFYSTVGGKCVKKEECPECGPNQVPSDCANNPCLPDCSEPERNLYCKPNPDNCKLGCVCAEGYIKDSSGVCIPKDKCPPICKKNEMYVNCTNQICKPETCDELGFPLPCYENSGIRDCGKPGCVCLDDFVRNKEGDCIPATECPSCGGDPHATTGDGSFCTTCSNYKQDVRPCLLIYQLNGCKCLPDYVYDEINHKCVLPKECPQCKVNEVPSTCANSPCLPSCSQPDPTPYCKPNPDGCKPGCVCAKGYVRDEKGNCVPQETCPPILQCSVNETYYHCPPPFCGSESCNDIGQNVILCSETTAVSSESLIIRCKPVCRCKDGYYRNKDNECVLEKDCVTCKINEVYSNCTNQICEVSTCDDLGYDISCLVKPDCGKPGCICQKGFVRNADKVCIPNTDCPSCGGDPNAVAGSGLFCETCSNYKDKIRECIKPYKINGCDCRVGFVYDDSVGKCVRPEECDIKCGRNEVPYYCANSPCIRDCKTKDLDLACKPYPPSCKKGCICAEGYYRDSNNICIPEKKCPPIKVFIEDSAVLQ